MQPGYQPRGPQFGSASPQRWIPAIILIGVGVVFLLDNLNILPVDQIFKFWPLLLIALGLFLLVDRTAWHIGIGRYGRDECTGAIRGRLSNPRVGCLWRRQAPLHLAGFRPVARSRWCSAATKWTYAKRPCRAMWPCFMSMWCSAARNCAFPIPGARWCRDTGVFGAFADNTRQPDPSRIPNPKRLIVKGAAVFGGVEVKN